MTKVAEFWQMCNDNNGLNRRQLGAAIHYMVLGDGHIEKPQRGNCMLSVSHVLGHGDYVLWKKSILDNFVGSTAKENVIKGGLSSKETHTMIRLRTKVHPWFTKAREYFYETLGRKGIFKHTLALLDARGLAILYQDDGSLNYHHKGGTNVLLHTLGFAECEVASLAKAIVDKWGLIFRVNRAKGQGFGYRLRLRAKDVDKFFEIVDPYIVPSMRYKVVRGGTPDTECGDMIWAMWKHMEVTGNE